MRKARIMENGTSKIERLIEAQRLAAELTALAVEHGAQHVPSVTCNILGVEVFLHLDTAEINREVAAWQLATGAVWDVQTTRFTYEGKSVKSERATVRVGDAQVHISVVTDAEMVVAA